jgi:hypothetical protein
MKIISEYLNQLQNDIVVTEGVTKTLNKIFAAVGMGKPRNWTFLSGTTPYKLLQTHYEKCLDMCAKIYRDEINKAEDELVDDMMRMDGLIQGDDEEAKERAERLPSLGYCELTCKFEMLKSMVHLMKKKPEQLCSKNINKNLCLAWINKNLPSLEIELNYVQNVVKVYRKGAKYPKSVANRLKKVL